MTTEQTTLPAQRTATAEGKPTRINMDETGLKLQNLEDAFRFAKYVAVSGLAPKNMDKPETILVCLQSGMELGFSPMQALQNITVINGRSNIYGDAGLALVRARGALEDMTEKWTGSIKDGTRKITLTMKRKGQTAIERSFSVDEAKQGGLWGKSGPWSQYPERMLRYRALSFGLRDLFSDILKGVAIAEEDYTPQKEKNITADVEVSDPRALALTTEEQPSTEPVAADNNKNKSTTSENLTSPPAPKFDRAAIIAEITTLIDNSKARKVSNAMKSAGIESWENGGSWQEESDDKLIAVRSFLKC